MSLFQDLLHIRSVRDAAVKGQGYTPTPGDLLGWLLPSNKEKAVAKVLEQTDEALPQRWTVIDGTVLDLDRLIPGGYGGLGHPGGQAVLRLVEGRDGSALFHSVHALAREETMSHWIRVCAVGQVSDFQNLAHLASSPPPFTWVSPLALDLRAAVRDHFAARAAVLGVSTRQAAKATPLKLCLVVTLWVLYITSFLAWLQGNLIGCLMMPFLGAVATFHTFHDASHGALSSRAWVNEVLTYTGFLIGAPHEWYWQHVAGHHAWTNIADIDPDSKHVRRWVKPKGSPPPLVSVPMVWSIAVPIGLQILYSFRVLMRLAGALLTPLHFEGVEGMGDGALPPRPSLASLCAMVLQRLVFFVWPLWQYGLSKGILWAGYPAVVFSLLFMLNTQLAHLNDVTGGEGPEGRSECWYAHQLATTVDFAPQSTLHWFVSGGLNLQVEHHLFPTVDHCHLPDLRLIIQKVCAAHGINVHTFSGYAAGIVSHARLLQSGSRQSKADVGGEKVD